VLSAEPILCLQHFSHACGLDRPFFEIALKGAGWHSHEVGHVLEGEFELPENHSICILLLEILPHDCSHYLFLHFHKRLHPELHLTCLKELKAASTSKLKLAYPGRFELHSWP
jgi:hypothetical protein